MDSDNVDRIIDELQAVFLRNIGPDHTAAVAALMIVAAQALASLSAPELIAHMEAFVRVLNSSLDTLAKNDADSRAAQAAQEAIRKAAA